MSPLRVHIADSDHFSYAGIMSVLSGDDDFVLEKSYRSINEAIKGSIDGRPDILLVEETLRGGDLDRAIRLIVESCPKTKVVIMAVTNDSTAIGSAHAAGSCGYITKDTIHAELPAALRMIASGYSIFARPSDQEIFPPRTRTISDRRFVFDSLSERERHLTALVASGITNARIARKMHMSEGSVKLYLARIMEQLKVSNRVQLAVLAAEVGLVTCDDLQSA